MNAMFLGDERRAVVDRLVREFDGCSADGRPRWVDLEAPSGWGKTRIVQELYRELSAHRQGEIPYWPEALSGHGDASLSVLEDRKVIRPLVSHIPGSLPTYMWWAITCSRARGHHTTALANDLRQLVAHVPYLDDALTVRRGRAVNLLSGGRQTARDLLDVGAEEAATMVLETVLSAAIPGLGFARPLARAVRGNVAERRERRRRMDGSELIIEDGDELVFGAVSLVQRISGEGHLPCVIVVEDLHLADRELVALLEAVVALESAQVLIVTTSWPGFVDENDHVVDAVGTARDLDRFVRFSNDASDPGAGQLSRLGDDDLARLVHSVFPGTSDDIIERVLNIADTPLAVMLTLDLPRFSRFRGGPLSVAPEDLPSGPSAVADIVRSIWQDMPETARFGIGIAALSTPGAAPADRSAISRLSSLGLAHLDEWDVDLLTDSLLRSRLSPDGLEEPGRVADRYAWSTPLSPSLRRFRDPLHFDIAAERIDEHLLRSEQSAYRQALSDMCAIRWGSDLSSADRELVAHLIVGLAASGSTVPGEILAEAGLVVVHPLQLEPTSWPDAMAFCDELARVIGDPIQSAPLEVWRWRIATEMGDTASAKRNLRRIIRELGQSADPLLLAEARHHLAVALANSGDVGEALDMGEVALATRRTLLGHGAEPTLRSLMNVAWFSSMGGEHVIAERELRDASERASHALGPAHPVTIAASIGWAAATAAAGDRGRAVERLDDLRRSMFAVIDRESPMALILDYNLLVARSMTMPIEDAHSALAALTTRARRTFGDNHPFIDELEESLHETTDEWDFFVQLMGVRSLG
jgi:hypothetical protein